MPGYYCVQFVVSLPVKNNDKQGLTYINKYLRFIRTLRKNHRRTDCKIPSFSFLIGDIASYTAPLGAQFNGIDTKDYETYDGAISKRRNLVKDGLGK